MLIKNARLVICTEEKIFQIGRFVQKLEPNDHAVRTKFSHLAV